MSKKYIGKKEIKEKVDKYYTEKYGKSKSDSKQNTGNS